MNQPFARAWKWVWPNVGATPINQGLDSEVFDGTNHSYSETFVREAIQNSLDARLDRSKPVLLKFSSHHDDVGSRRDLLTQLISLRETASSFVPSDWEDGKISWLLMEDFNTTGLSGSLKKRSSDFWNYWLNFGLSNKEGDGRGGRGYGRSTFFIASRLQTVIGYTRRACDNAIAVCGMTVLRAQHQGDDFKSTAAYLAESTCNDIFKLHDSSDFHKYVCDSLSFTGYHNEYLSGLGLAILYPHRELCTESILATAIEHFAPAIVDETLKLQVDGKTLDAESIEEIARHVVEHIHDDAIKNNVKRFLDLIRLATNTAPTHTIRLSSAWYGDLKKERDSEGVKDLQQQVIEGGDVVIEICFPLIRRGNESEATLKTAIGPMSSGQSPIDRLFRGGMSLPDVNSKTCNELDLIILVRKRNLATFLNFCEGKAHMDLQKSKEVIQTLTVEGYDESHARNVRQLVGRMPEDLRYILTPDITEPDSHVFDRYFSKPADKQSKRNGKVKPVDPIEPIDPIPPIPPPKPVVFKVEQLSDGLRIYANPEFSDWPKNVTVVLAYADGTRRPSWNPLDFKIEDLFISYTNCILESKKNRLRALNCGQDTAIEIKGFDTNRELDTTIRPW